MQRQSKLKQQRRQQRRRRIQINGNQSRIWQMLSCSPSCASLADSLERGRHLLHVHARRASNSQAGQVNTTTDQVIPTTTTTTTTTVLSKLKQPKDIQWVHFLARLCENFDSQFSRLSGFEGEQDGGDEDFLIVGHLNRTISAFCECPLACKPPQVARRDEPRPARGRQTDRQTGSGGRWVRAAVYGDCALNERKFVAGRHSSRRPVSVRESTSVLVFYC